MTFDLEKAPRKGILYEMRTDGITFEDYSYSEEECAKLEKAHEKILELHIFDNTKEYRYVKLHDREIECLIDEEEEQKKWDDVYEETVYVTRNSPEKSDELTDRMTVVNYIKYDENGMIQMKNYRFSTKRMEEK